MKLFPKQTPKIDRKSHKMIKHSNSKIWNFLILEHFRNCRFCCPVVHMQIFVYLCNSITWHSKLSSRLCTDDNEKIQTPPPSPPLYSYYYGDLYQCPRWTDTALEKLDCIVTSKQTIIILFQFSRRMTSNSCIWVYQPSLRSTGGQELIKL